MSQIVYLISKTKQVLFCTLLLHMDKERISLCCVAIASTLSSKMDGKIKRSRRSRSQRDRVRRRDAIDRNDQNRSPSSGSDLGQSPVRNKALCNYGKMTNLHYVRPPRPSRKKRRGSVSQEEDIIDGFAIASFLSLESLEVRTLAYVVVVFWHTFVCLDMIHISRWHLPAWPTSLKISARVMCSWRSYLHCEFISKFIVKVM